MRIAVIGGLAAGPAAAAEAVRTNPDAEVVLYEQGAHISIGACEIPYYVGDWIEERQQLVVLTPRQFEDTRGGTVKTRHRVTAIRPRERKLTVEALEFGSVHEERFDRFILAVGARARRLGLDGEDAPNVFTVRGYEDAVALKSYLDAERVRHAVVVGGGYIGVEFAEVFRSRGVRVTILEQAGRALPKTLSDELAPPFSEAVRAGGVTVREEVPTAFATDRYGRVNAVHTDQKEIIGCDLVLVAIGLEPRTELASAAGVKLGRTGAIAVDDGMQTNVANVWACGDCIEVPRVLDGKPVYFPLAPVGRRSARVAARNAASRARGSRARFASITRSIGVCAFGMEVARVGATVEEAREAGIDAVACAVRYWSRTRMYPKAKPIWVRLVVERGTGRLLGGELVGQEGAGLRADVLVPLIREEYTARRVLDEIDLIYNPPIAPAVDPLLVAASAAAKAAEASSRGRSGR
jgi:NADPH-dependent 2,4-dienoyl-CoA reductase/sulfur reductase-like enzyme